MSDSGDPSGGPIEAPDPLCPAVVLVRPREEGNVGAVARAMANLGLERLILVEPSAGGGVLAAMRRMGSEAMDREDVAALLLESGLAPVSQCQVGSLSVTWGVVTEATAMRQGQSARG